MSGFKAGDTAEYWTGHSRPLTQVEADELNRRFREGHRVAREKPMAEQGRAREIAKRFGLLGPNGNEQYAVEMIRAYGDSLAAQAWRDGADDAWATAQRDIAEARCKIREEALREAAEACWCNGCRNRILARIDQPQEDSANPHPEPDG